MLEVLLRDRRCYVAASLTVSLIIVFVATSELVKRPYDLYIAVGILILWVLFSLWRSTKIGSAKDSEKIAYNIVIKVECTKRKFEDTRLYSAESSIEEYGLAINKARKLFQDSWGVTESGRLIRLSTNKEKCLIATLEIDGVCLRGITLLEKVLAEKAILERDSARVWLHFENGSVRRVGVDKEGFYLE